MSDLVEKLFCPVCGKEVSIYHDYEDDWWVECLRSIDFDDSGCGLIAPAQSTKEKAIKAFKRLRYDKE